MDATKLFVSVLFAIVLIHSGFANRKQTALTVSDNKSEEEIVEVDSDSEEEIAEKFVPSKDWQTIKPGQSIPAGLHVRINLQTGVKEAKFLDKNDDHNDNSEYHSHDSIREALKAIKPEEIKQVVKNEKEKFRHIDDIKKDFDEIMVKVKTETEILKDLLENYLETTESEKIDILHNIEYVVHQYDAAQDFVKMNGLDLLIPDLNSTNSNIRALVAYTLGSAMQGNPKVQIACLEKNVMSQLLRMLSFDPDSDVRNKAMFGISCLVRQFPFAQQHLLKNGGFTAFADVFRDHKFDLGNAKLQMKIVNLIQDLITEQQTAHEYVSVEKDEFHSERLEQYQRLNLEAVLVQNGFCKIVPKFLSASDVDAQEKVVSAMLALVNFCQEEFKNNLDDLEKLHVIFTLKFQSEEDDDYFSQLLLNIESLIRKIKFSSKGEL